MGLLPSSIKLLISFHQQFDFQGPVLTLGNQEIWATYDDLKRYYREMECSFHESSAIVRHNSHMFTHDPTLTRLSREFVHARVFFEMMGIREYCDIDKFNTDQPIYQHDLNLPVPIELHNRFSLLLDGGTAEHIFDVKQVMANIVKMLRVNGCVIHICSFYIDHGFYGFSPCFYFDFYRSNGFDDLTCCIMQVDYRNIVKMYAQPCPYFEYRYGMQFDNLLDPNRQMLVFFVARKVRALSDCRIPVQGIYDKNGTLAPIGSQPSIQATPSSLYETYVPPRWQRYLHPIRPAARWLCGLVWRARRRVRTVKIRKI